MADLGGTFEVTHVKVKRAPGGKGILTISTSRAVSEGDTTGTSQDEPVYEVDWIEVSKALETHPIYQAGGAQALSSTDFAALSAWENEDDYELRAAFKFLDKEDTEISLSAHAQHIAAKKLNGIDSYVVYSPVVRATTYSVKRPITEACGVRSTPPSEAEAPSGYVWIKTGDRRRKSANQGKWQRDEEWTGAESVDEDLYPGGS